MALMAVKRLGTRTGKKRDGDDHSETESLISNDGEKKGSAYQSTAVSGGSAGSKSGGKRVYGQALDFVFVDEKESVKEILKAYDALYWLLNDKATYPGFKEFSMSVKVARFLQKPYPEKGERIAREDILETGAINCLRRKNGVHRQNSRVQQQQYSGCLFASHRRGSTLPRPAGIRQRYLW
jgi:hypothetical protein